MPAATDRFHSQHNGHGHDPYAGPAIEADDAETSVLSCIMLDPSGTSFVAGLVAPEEFRDYRKGLIYATALEIWNTGGVPDPMLLAQELAKHPAPEGDTWLGLLLTISETEPYAVNTGKFASRVREAARRRRVRSQLLQGLSAIESGEGDVGEIVAETVGELDQLNQTTGKKSRFEVLDAAALAKSNYSIDYLVEDVLVAGQPCLLGGPQKALKTSLALALFLSLAIGGMFLGRFKVNRRCRTLLLSGESGLGTIQETAARIAFAEGYDLASIEGWHVCSTIPQLASDEDLAELRKIIQRHDIDVVGIDPMYLAMPSSDVANLFAQGELLRRISAVCEALGATLILLHHTSRPASKTFEPVELTDLAFAGFPEFARQWLLLNRREKYECGGKHDLWLTIGGSAGHSSLWALDVDEGRRSDPCGRSWAVTVRHPDEVRQDDQQQQAEARAQKRKQKEAAELDHDKKEICRYLAQRKDGDTQRGIRDRTGISASPLKRAIAALFTDGAIVEVPVTKNGRTEDGITLNSEGKTS